ncbi:MAG TPA: hypothetical protein VIM42_04905, partial [Clostridium sp.]
MKFPKKLTTLILTLSLAIGTSLTVFAAPNDDVITALQNAKVPATYVIKAQNYLATTTLTSAQSTAVVAEIANVKSIMTAAGVTVVTHLSAAQKSQVLADIKAAGSDIGLTISYTKLANGQYSIVARNQAGTIVMSFTTNQVKQTGIDNSIIYLGALMVILAAGSVFVLRRNN